MRYTIPDNGIGRTLKKIADCNDCLCAESEQRTMEFIAFARKKREREREKRKSDARSRNIEFRKSRNKSRTLPRPRHPRCHFQRQNLRNRRGTPGGTPTTRCDARNDPSGKACADISSHGAHPARILPWLRCINFGRAGYGLYRRD